MTAISDINASLRKAYINRRPSLARAWRRGAAATEYLLILALVVIPIGLLLPLFMRMITGYAGRIYSLVGLPFP